MPVALKEAMETLLPDFERETAERVDVVVMLNPEVPGYVVGGATWDLAMTNPCYVEEILAAGHGAPGSHRPFGRSPLAFGTRDADARLGGRQGRDVAELLLEAESIALTRTGTSGSTFARLVETLGLRDALEAKLRPMAGGGPMAALIAGEVDVAALPLTNIAPVPGVSAVAICPVALDVHIDLSMCLSRKASETASALAEWLLDPARDVALGRLGAERFSLDVRPNRFPERLPARPPR